ncbi:MAG: EAL domain-containing protein, partial [Dechloromonas sp.]|nr:EAL domain-containing protein [Dechloromonas sp.]
NHLFKPILQTLPYATSIVAGTSSGQGWMLLQLPDEHWRNRLTDLPRWGKKHLFQEQKTGTAPHQFWQTVDYDPRTRAWYKGAMSKPGSIHWTAPYTFFTTGDPGITAAIRMPLADGRDLVLGIDLMLRDLSLTTMQARISPHGLALVLTDDLKTLALPSPPAQLSNGHWLSKILQPANTLGHPAVSDALLAWQAGGQKIQVNFQSNGQPWFASFADFDLGERHFWVVTLAPASDFAPPWLSITLAMTAGLVIMLLLAAWTAERQARRIARPLEQLSDASQRIGQLDFHTLPPDDSGIAEISLLAKSHDRMRALLAENQQQIAEQKNTLLEQIAALNLAKSRLRESEAYTKVLFSDSRIPLVVLDPENGKFIDCNLAAARIYGLTDKINVIGLTVGDVSPENQANGNPSADAVEGKIKQACAEGSCVFEWLHRRPDGQLWDGEVHLMAFQHDGRLLLQFSLQDVTARKHAAAELEHMALYDALTQLPNRAFFLDNLQQAIHTASHFQHTVAVFFLDLDRFKEVNDTQGHAVGDEVLREVALRFRAVLRNHELLARLGGDEFAVLATDIDQSKASTVANRLNSALAAPLEIGHHTFSLGVSIGIAIYPSDGLNPDALLRAADIAMYRAKTSASGFTFYDPKMSSGLIERIALARDLKLALQTTDQPSLSLCYQPQFNLGSGQLIGAEALLRWQHPLHGPISPAVFIPIAEERGMMTLVSTWVMREASRQLLAWRHDGLQLPGRLAINIAAQQMEDSSFPQQIAEQVAASGLEPRFFELELTESGMMRNIEHGIAVISALNNLGFAQAIDDFGTGYSSLAYLKRLPAEKLKIDQSFVRDMIEDNNDHAIVATIIGMGRNLGMKTIAEGVETQAQADALRALGCDEAQGYFYGRPVNAAEFAQRWL